MCVIFFWGNWGILAFLGMGGEYWLEPGRAGRCWACSSLNPQPWPSAQTLRTAVSCQMLEMFSVRLIACQVSSKASELLQWLYFMFKAGLGKWLETILAKNAVFLRMGTGCSAANCCVSAVSVCKEKCKKLTSRVDCLRGEKAVYFLMNKKILWFRNSIA